MRSDQRSPNQLRDTTITPNYLIHAEGSVLIQAGNTKVICAASVEDRVPNFLRNTGKGWVTAEYGMLPRATSTRTQREASQGKVGGRTQEIQRLIGRSLRSVTNLPALGERTIWIDCDVIQADGGTRTAAITGGWVALALALRRLQRAGKISKDPLRQPIAATARRIGSAAILPACASRRAASASATQPPVMAAVRVPPSAWMTSQSSTTWRSPSLERFVTARKERPISRWIS